MFSMLAKGKQGVTKIDSAFVRSSRRADACMCRKGETDVRVGLARAANALEEDRHSRFGLASMGLDQILLEVGKQSRQCVQSAGQKAMHMLGLRSAHPVAS